MYGNSLDGAFTALLVVAGVAGAAIFALLFWLVPWLWELVKPWLHTVTA
ncbi:MULTISPECIES: hypothetical protein [Xanthomonas]|nr:hypothetical protein [Xanthomonas phaseoli]MBO9766503.1 hypothetical protein [Xanthomonas phaseoli pv. dieffenbachiae]MBO9776152.1 hypothetical protein [Xanthomonas phaseoli pv. dieffenbachiae]MBO9778249.1 hypothetical protein [Xanthomonas phaseoli pv. dieffenbachiae]MBO9795362.1 hypothetical protein [Xanthomonas phaseoli pv. dieffenbachiae]MBO9801443.1 hypothetical protein [Xanthomonas phaseoli pv. dieffenbachiae]